MWWKAEVPDLHRVEDRLSTVYIERCHLDRDENAVVVVNRERTVRIPAAMLGAVLLGPGTRTTHAAIALLADSGTSVCWVGESGVRMYATGLGAARGAQVIHRQAFLVTRPSERLKVARTMYQMRFPGDDVSRLTLQQLRGKEGGRVKQLYRDHSERTGVRWDKRKYRVGESSVGDDVNRMLSAANTALYGGLMPRIVRDVLMLLMGTAEASLEDSRDLWDDGDGSVEGGVNWNVDDFLAGFVEISGPPVAEQAGLPT